MKNKGEINMKKVLINSKLLCKSFVTDGETSNVIRNLNLDIYENDFTVIMGSSGSGKSTLLYLLSGMDKATSGTVCLDGEDITNYTEKQMSLIRRKKLGFVFQNINLISELTVYENVLSPSYGINKNKKDVDMKIKELIQFMSLEGHENKFPNQLSGGQRQRVAICRALINDPRIIFADEPTGALNSSQGENVLDIFTDMNDEGQSVVMVTHDLKAACRATRLIFLKDGRIDGELQLEKFNKNKIKERENIVFNFLKERGW